MGSNPIPRMRRGHTAPTCRKSAASGLPPQHPASIFRQSYHPADRTPGMVERPPSLVRGAVERTGPTADDPRTAALLVAALAAGYGLLWFGVAGVGGLVAGTPPLWTGVTWVAGMAALLAATVANAYVVTYLVWGWLVPAGRWGYRRGAGAGLAVGVGSCLTVGPVWTVVLLGATTLRAGFAPGAETLQVADAAAFAAYFSAFSPVLTLGAPLSLSVAAGTWLTYARRQTQGGRQPAPGGGASQ